MQQSKQTLPKTSVQQKHTVTMATSENTKEGTEERDEEDKMREKMRRTIRREGKGGRKKDIETSRGS